MNSRTVLLSAFSLTLMLLSASFCYANENGNKPDGKKLEATPQTYIFTNQSNVDVLVNIHGDKCIKENSWSGGWIEPNGKRYAELTPAGGAFRECGWRDSWVEYKISNPKGDKSNNGHVEMTKVPGQPWGAVRCLRDYGSGFKLHCTGVDVFIKNP